MYEILKNKLTSVNMLLCYFNMFVIIMLFSKKEEPKKKPANKWNIWSEENRYTERDVNTWYIIPGKAFCRYKGEWSNGLAHGKGVKEIFGTTDVDHSIMEGNFVNGYINGYGKQTYDITADHEEFAPYYQGEFKSGTQHGNGTYHYGDGCYRSGTLVDGKYQGAGVFYNKQKNRTWIGTYVDDVRGDGFWHDGEIGLDNDILKEEKTEPLSF